MAPREIRKVPAFAFDIDGVLVKSKTPIPGAAQTIATLQKDGIPFIFLTNGGGLTEEVHTEKLASRLDLSLDARQFVQSHTPYRDLVDKYADKPILVLGGTAEQIRDVARAYGFRKVITSADIFLEDQSLHPFPELTGKTLKDHGRRWDEIGLDAPINKTPIEAILVWSSPRDWCLDLQLVLDLMLSKSGLLGTKSPKNGSLTSNEGEPLPNNGYLQDNQPALYFCNPDITWATQAAQPRLALGAFKAALEGIWHCETGGAVLESTTCGKPTHLTYTYGEETLKRWAERNPDSDTEISTVYMIGDNPSSDIQGANSFASERYL